MKSIFFGLAAVTMLAGPAMAENIEYPTPTPYIYPFQRSVLTRGIVTIPPYWHPFRVRVYTTPQQQPYYNVPPYPVVSPY